LEAEISSLKSQIALQSDRIRLSDTLVAPAAQLSAKGFMSDVELKRRQEALLEQKQSLNALNQQMAARESQLADTRYSLEQVPTVIAEKIQLLRNELSTTEQRMAEINGRRAYVIRAPTAGRVAALMPHRGRRRTRASFRLRSCRQMLSFMPSCLSNPRDRLRPRRPAGPDPL
jgi:membrane fusion protein